jgi:hypothetical protein
MQTNHEMKIRRYVHPLNTFFVPVLSAQGLPIVKACEIVPEVIFPYKLRSQRVKKADNAGLHFFIDDWRFEGVWRYPEKSISYLKQFHCVIAPDFSLYLDMPSPAKLWNTYRNRWVNSFWNLNGIEVIPCISWAQKESFSYCFDSIPKNSVIAISSMGIFQESDSEKIFLSGVEKLVEVLIPKTILVYGTKFEKKLRENYSLNFKFYPHYRKYGR